MKLEEVQSLSGGALRIKVAELCGWARYPDKDRAFGHEYWARFSYGHFAEDTSEYEDQRLPDYCNDLNAMHEAEKLLGTRVTYTLRLWDVVCPQCNQMTGLNSGIALMLIQATARQRAEAFVLTMETE